MDDSVETRIRIFVRPNVFALRLMLV